MAPLLAAGGCTWRVGWAPCWERSAAVDPSCSRASPLLVKTHKRSISTCMLFCYNYHSYRYTLPSSRMDHFFLYKCRHPSRGTIRPLDYRVWCALPALQPHDVLLGEHSRHWHRHSAAGGGVSLLRSHIYSRLEEYQRSAPYFYNLYYDGLHV